MVIDQRNAGASVTPANGVYTLDRWAAYLSQTSKFSIQQNAGSITPPAGFTNYLGVTSLSSYSITSTDFFVLSQRIEGFNAADLGWGTANAKTVTLSFWVRSSLTGTFGGSFTNQSDVRSYLFSYTISAANTWEYKTVTVAGDTSGTWQTGNGVGLSIYFGLGVGSTLSGTTGSWATSSLYSATGATSVVGTNGATLYITGVQLEVGVTATSFDFRSIGQELALCQRYLPVIGTNPGTFTSIASCGIGSAGTGGIVFAQYPVPARTQATGITLQQSVSTYYIWQNDGNVKALNALTFYSSSNQSATLVWGAANSTNLTPGGGSSIGNGTILFTGCEL
jgi:hypothetical protein